MGDEYFDPFFFFDRYRTRIGEKKSFLNTIIHTRIRYIRTKCRTFLRIRSSTWTLFFVTQHTSGNAEHPFVLHQRPILFISKLQMLTASHYPSLCLITNASCIVIIAWNLSAIGSRRIRTIIVESFHFEDELIERCVKKHRARHIKDFLFSFLFFFQILYWKILYFFMFSFWKDRSVKRETDVHRCSLILRWFSKWSFHVEWLNAFNNLYWIMEFMSHLRNIPRRYLPMSLGKWDWFTFHEYYIISRFLNISFIIKNDAIFKK